MGAESMNLIQQLELANNRLQSEMGPCLEASLSKHLEANKVRVDFKEITQEIKRGQQETVSDIREVLKEVSRIQQELGVDFNQVFQEITNMKEGLNADNIDEDGIPEEEEEHAAVD